MHNPNICTTLTTILIGRDVDAAQLMLLIELKSALQMANEERNPTPAPSSLTIHPIHPIRPSPNHPSPSPDP